MFPMLKGCCPYLHRHCSSFRVLITAWLLVVIWNEYLVFIFYSLRWSTLRPHSHSPQNPVIVLFVADPQIIGFYDEPKNTGPISRWDSDRYLQKSFSIAFSHAKPDVVVFLGDLLDEGSQASPEDYQLYMKRFRHIFDIPSVVQTVYIPGDNDIGGEGFDRKEPFKVAAFNQHFLPGQIPPKDVINVKHVDFLRLDLAPNEVAAARVERELYSMRQQSTAAYRVLCSHVSVIDRSSHDQNQIISQSGADVIFSAHTHYSNIIICNDCGSDGPQNRQWKNFQGITIPLYDYRIYYLNLNDKQQMYEIQVPTCSYRMGVSNMGYGLASFASDGSVQYTVLWLPKRYSQLWFYIVLFLCMVIWLVFLVSRIILYPLGNKICYYIYPYCEAYSPINHTCMTLVFHRLKLRCYYTICPSVLKVSAIIFKHRSSRVKSVNSMA